jgi:hypothetical protein
MKVLNVPLLFLACLVLLSGLASARDVPSWFLALPDDSDQLMGRGMAEVGQDGEAIALENARRDAMRNMSESLLCRLTTEVIDQHEENDNDLESCFTSRTVVESGLDLVNVGTLEQAVSDGVAYVLVGADREAMKHAYRDRTERAFHAAAEAFSRGGALEKEDDAQAARAAYKSTLAALSDARQRLQVYLALSGWLDPPPRPPALPDDAVIHQRLNALSARTPQTLAEVAQSVAAQLTADVESGADAREQTWMVLPLTHEHTELVSSYGHQLQAALSTVLARQDALRVTDDPARADVVVRGRMLREGNSVLLVFEAGEYSAQYYLSPVTCQSIGKTKLEPANLKQALADQLALQKAMQASPGLRVELKTDRGHDGPIVYRYGDQPKLTVRADRACYIRLIDVTADGQRVLLLDKYPIAEHQVNRWVRLPLDVEVCAPAGVEQLLVQAATQADDTRLPPLKVRNVDVGDGFFIPMIEETLDDAMSRTRGLMKKKKSHFAEYSVQWTVFEK